MPNATFVNLRRRARSQLSIGRTDERGTYVWSPLPSLGNTSACLSKNPHLNPLPLAKGEASSVCMLTRKYDVISHESVARVVMAQAKKEGFSPHFSRLAPLCGERIEVRGAILPSEVTLITKMILRESRSFVAKESNPERVLASFAEPKFCRLQISTSASLASCYILDFYCQAAKLAIELDGGGHNYRGGQIRDRMRSEFLARKGITVLRFWNHQVRHGTRRESCKAIWFALQERCSSKPSP